MAERTIDEGTGKTPTRRRFARRLVGIVVRIPLALVVFVIALLVVLQVVLSSPLLMRPILAVVLPRVNALIHADIRVGSFSLSLMRGRLVIEDAVFTREHDTYREPFAGAKRIVADISLAAGLKGKLRVKQLDLYGGWNYLYIDSQGLRNLPDFPTSDTPSEPFTELTLPIVVDRLVFHDLHWGMDMPDLDMVIRVTGIGGSAACDMDALGWADADLTMKGGSFRLGTIDQTITRVDVLGGFSFKKFYAEAKRVHLETTEATVDASGRIENLLGEIAMRYRASVTAQLAPVNRMFTPEPRLTGTAVVEATLDAPTIPAMTIDATAKVAAGTVNDLALRDLAAAVHMTLKRIDLTRLTANLAGGTVAASGRVDLADPLTIAARADLARVNVGAALSGYGLPIGAQGVAEGTARWNCVLAEPTRMDAIVDLTLAGASYETRKGPAMVKAAPLTIRGGAKMIGKTVTVDAVTIDAPNTAIRAQGRLVLPDGVDAGVVVRSRDLGDFKAVMGRPIGGSLEATAKLGGRFAALEADAILGGKGLRFGAYAADALSAEVKLRGDRLTIGGLNAARGETTIAAEGEVDLGAPLSLDLTARVRKGRLEDVAEIAGIAGKLVGPFDLTARVTGPLEELDGEGTLAVGAGAAYGEALRGIDLRFTAADGVFAIDRLVVGKGEGTIEVAGTVDPFRGSLALSLLTQGLRLADLDAAGAEFAVQAGLDIEAKVAGAFTKPEVMAQISASDVRAAGLALGDVSAEATLQGTHAIANLYAFGGQVAAGADLDLAGTRPLSAVAYFENFDLAFLRALSAPLADVSGELHGEVAAEGTLDDVAALRYRAAIDTLRLAKSTVTIANERPIRLAFQGERLSADDFRLVGKGLDLRLVAPGPGGGLGAADLALDLGVIADLVPALGEAKGTLTLDLRADGPLRDPRLSGALAVADADVALINFPQPIDHLTLAVDIEPEALHVRTLTAAVGGGTLEGGGSIALAGFSPSRYDLFLRGTDVATGYAPAYVEAKIDRLDLLLSGPPGGLDLAGDIYLDQAVYTRNVDLPYVLSFFRGAGLQGSEVFQRRRAKALTFNVGIHADGGLRVKSNLADIEASADAILTGDNTRYGLLGDVVVLDGRANFAKADYEIVSGLVQFFDETRIFPVFDVTANTTVSDVAITVNVSGNADRFNLAFTSDPPQSDQEIIALLTGFDAAKVQETVRGQGGATDGPTREEAAIRVGAQVVTGQLNSVFSKYVGMRIGVDTGPTGDTRLRVTRDLSKNLAASYYWKIFGQGFGADLEYDFLRFMALVGSWETDPTIQSQSTIGAFGAGLQFQLDFQ